MSAQSLPPRPAAGTRSPRPLRGDIEGLRAVAVLTVLLYHAGVPGFSGGFAGVDVFFVISGYLITSQLVNEASSRGTVSLTRFYARRARRLLPAASLVLVVTSLAGWWLLPTGRRTELGHDVIGSTLYVVNWVLAAREVDYLAEDADPSLLQHYWSLSVEEQFYVVWPVVIILSLLVARRWGLPLRPLLAVVLGSLVVASFAWSVIHTAQAPGRAYFVSTTRVWELGLGAMLVLLHPVLARLGRPAAASLAAAGLAMVLIAVVTVSTATPWPGSAALLPTGGTAATIAAGIAWTDNPVCRALGVPPMRFVGGLSYGLYLWHWPALQLLQVVRPDADLPLRLLVATGSILAAWATLHLVENPVRYQPALARSAGRALVYGGTTMVVSAAAGAAVLLSAPSLDTSLSAVPRSTEGVGPGALALVDPSSTGSGQPRFIADPPAAFTDSGQLVPDPATAISDTPRRAYAQGCQVDGGETSIVADDACWFGDPEGEATVALVGDSKMLQWLPALEAVADVEGWRIKVYTKSACAFVTVGLKEDCHAYNTELSRVLASPGSTPDVLLTSTVAPEEGGMADSMAALLQPVQQAGARVVMVGDNPAPDGAQLPGRVSAYECAEAHPDDYSACSYQGDPGSGNEVLDAAAEQLDAAVVDVSDWVCPPGSAAETDAACPIATGGVLIFRQGTHLTATYVRTLAPLLHAGLVEAGVAAARPGGIVWEPAPDRDTTG